VILTFVLGDLQALQWLLQLFNSDESEQRNVNRLFSVPDEAVFRGQSNDNFELLKAWAGTTLAYAILISRGNFLTISFLINLLISGIVCGLAFVLHELAHRVVARNYRAEAHFVANNGWLLISIVIAFAGFFIAAPGAVWHRGFLTKRQGGLIALAGPATNLALAILFLIPLSVLTIGVSTGRIVERAIIDMLLILCQTGFSLNAWIGLFNMIPAGPFDGAKVLDWDPKIFGITVAIGIFLAFIFERIAPTLLNWAVRFF
jgi:Zn-dependent protease